MTKSELVKAMAVKAGISQKAAAAALDAQVEEIKKALKRGEKISLLGFGTFEVRQRAARTGVNPATGAKIAIKATKVPAFKAGKALKDFVK